MGFYQQMRNTFGREAVAKLRNFSHNQIKISSLVNRRIFLLSCRRHGLIPRHITDRVTHLHGIFEYRDGHTGKIVQDFHNRLAHRILSIEVSITIKNLSFLRQCQFALDTELQMIFPADILDEFKHRSQLKYNSHFRQTRSSNINNLNRLTASRDDRIRVSENWFRNLSRVNFPKDVSDFLSLGTKFSIAPTKQDVSIPRILAEIESINVDHTTYNKNLITTKVTNILTNYLQKQGTDFPNYNSIYNKSRKFLRDHPEVVIIQADKGGVTVAIDRQQYTDLSNEILSDRVYYQQLTRDPTSSLQQKANKIVSELKKSGSIQAEIARDLMIYNAVPARFYGLPKIHKPQLSLRPIISSLNCPNAKIAKFITDILTNSYNKDNTYFVSDSFHFASLINEFKIPEGFVLASLDVVSLFSNIPLDLALQSIDNRWDQISNFCNLNREDFKKLVTFVFESTYFTFNNSFFKQTFGTPMGSVVSPIISLYVMDDLLDAVQQRLPYKFPIIKKYVDDIFCVLPSDQMNATLDICNSINERIQFTIEKESPENSVPFLDTLVIRTDQILRTDWYSKPTSSGRYLNYKSYHTTKMKVNVAVNMRNRILRVSHPTFHRKNLDRLYDIMLKNSYPPPMLRKLIFSTPLQRATRDEIADLPNSNFFYKSIPYIRGVSERLMSILSHVDGVKFALSNCKTLRSLFSRIKDTTPLLQQTNVVYSLKCTDCNSIYIGQTSRNLTARITSHRSDIKRNILSCALSKHVNETGHSIDFQHPTTLDREKNSRKRTFLEMVRISQADDSMNYRRDIDGLSVVYTYLLELDKSKKINRSFSTSDLQLTL